MVIAAFCMPVSASAMDKIVLQLRWDHQFQFAGYYAAKLNKYYEEAGLDVEVRSAIAKDGTILQAVDEVSSGRVQFGVGAADILVANDAGEPLMVSAVILQQSAAAFYAKKGVPLSSPRDFVHLRVARSADDLIDVELQTMLRAEGIDPKTIKAYPHQPGIDHFANGAVDVLPGYAISVPFDLDRAGISYTRIEPTSYGVDFYGDSLFFSAELAHGNPELVRKFTEASLKGWRYALEHSEEIALKISENFPRHVTDALDGAFNKFQIAGVKRLSHYPVVELGYINPGRWAAMHAALTTAGLVQAKFDPGTLVFDPERAQLEQDALTRRWMWIAVGLLVGAGLIAFGFIRVLRNTVRIRTKELEREIFERKQAEHTIRQSAERTRHILHAAKVGLWEWNLETDAVYFSPEWKQQLGYSDDAIANQFDEWQKRIHPEDLAYTLAAVDDFRFGRAARHSVETRLLHRDGSWRWILAESDLEYNHKGEPILMMGSHIDVTERKQAKAALKQSNHLLEVSQVIAKVGGWEFDLATKTLFWTAETYRIHDTSPEEFNPNLDDCVGYFLPESRSTIAEALQAAMERGEGYDLELQTNTTKGRLIDVRTTCEVTWKDGRPWKLAGIFQDITQHKQVETALISAKKVVENTRDRLLLAADSGHIGVWEYDLTDRSIHWDAWMYRLYGIEPNDTLDLYKVWSHYLHPEDKANTVAALRDGITGVRPYDTEFRIVWRDGSIHYLRATARVTRDEQGKALRMIGVNWDITELKKNQQQLEHIAHYDALTKLPNRVLLALQLQRGMAQCLRREKMLAVAFLDLDGFKAVNDRHGHAVGDKFLVELAQIMKAALREGDTLGRLGGDEFVAILADLDGAPNCEPVLQRLLEAASTSITLSEGTFQVSASIGVTLYPQDDVDADQLLRHADQAMYVAKAEGKNRYRLFDVAQDSASKRHREILESIRSALDHNEFVLYYQPKVNIENGAVVGAEALIRWQHPQQGLLAPGLFLPMIEGQAISVELGEWVIHTALQQISTWRAAGLDMQVSVNVNALQLQDGAFVEKLTNALAAHPNMPRGRLGLEIVETSALEDVAQVSALMHTCLGLGVGFALDDFGTGYSSLTYLKRLPADLLKIDQGFVRDMLTDPDDLAIVQGVIGLAKVFKREVIAEGVETEAHARKLLELGCELAQGYGIARPMPAADLPAWVGQWTAKAVWTA